MNIKDIYKKFFVNDDGFIKKLNTRPDKKQELLNLNPYIFLYFIPIVIIICILARSYSNFYSFVVVYSGFAIMYAVETIKTKKSIRGEKFQYYWLYEIIVFLVGWILLIFTNTL